MSSNLLLVVVGIAGIALVEAAYFFVRSSSERSRTELRQRLQALDEQRAVRLERLSKMAKNPALAELLRTLPFATQLERLLMQTDLPWTVASVLASGAMIGVVTFAGMLLLFAGNLPFIALGTVMAFSVPIVAARISRTRRSVALSGQLPEALDMMVRSLRAGYGIGTSFKLVATEMPVPVAVEFARCFDEQNSGLDFAASVENMTRRVPDNLDLRIFAMSVVLQHETGGNLIELLEQIAHTIRERDRFRGKVEALTAETKVSGAIMAALPFFVVLAISGSNPGYLRVLVDDPTGRLIAFAGVSMWLFGGFWLYKLSQVEF